MFFLSTAQNMPNIMSTIAPSLPLGQTRACLPACLEHIPTPGRCFFLLYSPFYTYPQKIGHRVPPSMHRYYNIYKVRFVHIFQFVQISPYNILFICQMPLTTTSTIQLPNHQRHRLSVSYRKNSVVQH